MVSRSMSQVRKWTRRIGGGALVLALAGLLAPATTSARIIDSGGEEPVYEDPTGEDINVCGPGFTDIGGTCWPDPLTEPGGGSTDPGTNYDPSGGYSGGGGGPVYGGGTSSSGGGISPAGRAALARLAAAKKECLSVSGVWSSAVFKDLTTNIAYAGYSCRWKSSPTQYIWLYFDSEGYVNQVCKGDLDVQSCDYP